MINMLMKGRGCTIPEKHLNNKLPHHSIEEKTISRLAIN